MAVEIPGWVDSLERQVREDIEAQEGSPNVVLTVPGEQEAKLVLLALGVLSRVKEQREIRETNVRHISEQIVDGQGFNEMSKGVLERFGRDLSMMRVLLEGK